MIFNEVVSDGSCGRESSDVGRGSFVSCGVELGEGKVYDMRLAACLTAQPGRQGERSEAKFLKYFNIFVNNF